MSHAREVHCFIERIGSFRWILPLIFNVSLHSEDSQIMLLFICYSSCRLFNRVSKIRERVGYLTACIKHATSTIRLKNRITVQYFNTLVEPYFTFCIKYSIKQIEF